ncbi:MAG: type II toxin-antitoxin system HicB family antitoxin [Candidatus Hydrogenedentes bacterium]|nr:type II toxin-antitoxin system HicB family antitoxin [Candidatus Hydrogenedentota bacterium]
MNEATIRLHIEPLEEGGYLATSPDVPGLVVEARSVTEAVDIAQDLSRKLAECYLEEGAPLPPALRKLIENDETPFDLLIPISVP